MYKKLTGIAAAVLTVVGLVVPSAPEIHIPDTISTEHVSPAAVPEMVKVS